MKKFLSFLLILASSILLCACTLEKQPKTTLEQIRKRDKIIVGIKSDAKPFGFKDENGQITGFDADLAHIIAEKLLNDPNKVDFVEVTPSNRIITLTSGKVDMIIATMSITPQRQRVVSFSTPYYIAGQALMTPQKSSIQGLTDLKDKKVIVVLGSTGEKSIKYFAPNAIIQGFKNTKDAYNALKRGQGDALTTDDTILAGIAMDDPDMRILAKRYTQEPYAIAFRTEPESDSLRRSINHILEHLKKSGELTRLKNKWIEF